MRLPQITEHSWSEAIREHNTGFPNWTEETDARMLKENPLLFKFASVDNGKRDVPSSTFSLLYRAIELELRQHNPISKLWIDFEGCFDEEDVRRVVEEVAGSQVELVCWYRADSGKRFHEYEGRIARQGATAIIAVYYLR